jgi:hypothetical protein
MAVFQVSCFNEAAKPDGLPDRKIEAATPHEAAEVACCKQLFDSGKAGQLRAQVWLPARPEFIARFYASPRPAAEPANGP